MVLKGAGSDYRQTEAQSSKTGPGSVLWAGAVQGGTAWTPEY